MRDPSALADHLIRPGPGRIWKFRRVAITNQDYTAWLEIELPAV